MLELPSPKKSKKKGPADEKQRSLSSFIAPPKPPKEKVRVAPKKIQKEKKETTEKSAEKKEEKEEIKKTQKIIEKQPEKAKPEKKVFKEIPRELFFKGNDAPFGLKEGKIPLGLIKRE